MTLSTILIQEDTTIKELKLSSYLTVPFNETTFQRNLKIKAGDHEENSELMNINEDFDYFLRQSKNKLESFLKYNSIVDLTYENGKLDFVEWNFKLKISEFVKKASKGLMFRRK